VLVTLSRADFTSITVTLKYKVAKTSEEKTMTLTVDAPKAKKDHKAVAEQELRLRIVDTITTSMKEASAGNFAKAVETVMALAKAIKESDVAKEKAMKSLLADVEGQMVEAVSKEEFFKKWGRHYLPSLMGAHLQQQCNNFKDPGGRLSLRHDFPPTLIYFPKIVQRYAGKLFQKLRDDADTKFLKLPAPTPMTYGQVGGAHRAAVNMADYNSSGYALFN